MIHLADIVDESVVDGEGLRIAVFLKGCPRCCPGCHNEALISPDGANEITEKELAALILSKVTTLHQGITFSGGDPLMQADGLTKVISYIKEKNNKLDIWVYTGYLYEEVKDMPLIKMIDVLVDGPFMLDKRDLSLAFRGSTNQKVIDIRKTLTNGKISEYNLEEII